MTRTPGSYELLLILKFLDPETLGSLSPKPSETMGPTNLNPRSL